MLSLQEHSEDDCFELRYCLCRDDNASALQMLTDIQNVRREILPKKTQNECLHVITLDDWRCDQYRWVNEDVKQLPRKEPCIKKSYFHIRAPNEISSAEFVQHTYQLLDMNNTAVSIHYLASNKHSSPGMCGVYDSMPASLSPTLRQQL